LAYGTKESVQQRSGLSYTDLKLSSQVEYDTLTDAALAAATDAINRFCQRDFDKHVDAAFKMDGSNTFILILPGYPVITINSIKISDVLVDADDYRLQPNPTGPSDENSGLVERNSFIWPYEWNNILIDYEYGYEDPPDTVIDVAESMAVQMLREIKQNLSMKSGAHSYSMDGFSVTYLDNIAKMQTVGDSPNKNMAVRFPDLNRLLMFKRRSVN